MCRCVEASSQGESLVYLDVRVIEAVARWLSIPFWCVLAYAMHNVL